MADLLQQSPPAGIMYKGNGEGEGILNQWDAMKEDIASTLFFPYGDQSMRAMSSIINAFGQRQEVYQPTWNWFEQDRKEVSFSSNGNVNIASGEYIVTLPTDEVDPNTGYSWPSEQDVWEHARTGAKFLVRSKPAGDTLVLKPTRSEYATVTILAGDTFFYVDNTSPEKSGPPAPKYYFSTKYSVDLKISRHDKDSSGSALFNQMWYTTLQNGYATPYSNSTDVIDLQRTHTVGQVNSFLAGSTSDNLSLSEEFGSFDGLNTTIENRGQSEDTAGNPTVEDFYALENRLSQQDDGVRNYVVLMAGYMFQKIEQNLLEYLKQTNIATTNQELNQAFFGDGMTTEMMRTTLDFKGLTLQGKNFALTRLGLLDNPTMYNSMAQATNPWQNYAFFLPVGSDANDGNGNIGKYVRLVHKPERFQRMVYTGLMSNKGNQTRTDELAIDIISEYAYAFLCANRYGRLYNASLGGF